MIIMALIEQMEGLQRVAGILGTKVQEDPGGIINVYGVDYDGRKISLTIKPVTPVVEICNVGILDQEDKAQRVRLLNGQVTTIQPEGITTIQDVISGDSFTVGPNSPASIHHNNIR